MSDIHRHLVAAQGFMELGMFVDAANELEEIDTEARALPQVIAFRVAIYTAMEKWDMAEVTARHMAKVAPEEPGWWVHWAYATRRSRSVEHAKNILLDAEVKHPQDANIQFNLGCYACQLGDLKEAKSRVAAAISLDPQFRLAALDDEDLKPLWDEFAVILRASEKSEG